MFFYFERSDHVAELSRFFNSVTGDERTYQAEDFAQFFQNFLGNGFFEGLEVSAENTTNTIIAPGSAFIEGHDYRNTTSLTLVHDPADATNDRIDRVVLRLNKDIDIRNIKAFIKKGETSSNPSPPNLTRNNYEYELSLAQVRIVAGKSYIDGSQITDERGHHELCGRVQVARRVGDQINTVDIKTVEARPEDYSEGISQFYMSGRDQADIFQGWLDSIGINPGKYGRSLESLRAYVHTIGNRTNTGVQTITIFAWDWNNNYEIYGEFKRANNAVSSNIEWGQWQENQIIVQQGSNSNGEYVRYSNGVQECWGNPFSLQTSTSVGALYRSDPRQWTYPKEFASTSDLVVMGDIRSFDRWVTVSTIDTTQASVSAMGVYNSSAAYTTMLYAKGRWR